MAILTLLVIVFLLAIFWVRRRYSYFERLGVPHDPASFPYGNLKSIGGVIHPALILQKFYTKFKGKAPLAGIYFFILQNVIITDLELVKDVLIRNFDSFRNRGIYYNERDDPLTGHILAIEDQPWRNMRAKLTPTFTSGKMKMMFETLLDVSQHWLDWLSKVENIQMIEVKEILAKFTTDVIGNVAFGLEMNAIDNPDSQFRAMGKKLFSPENNFIVKVFFFANFRTLARKLRAKVLPTEISDFFLKIVRENVNYRIANNIERNDFFNLLLKMHTGESNEGRSLSLNEMAANCFIFFNAGFETSSSTATFALYHLSKNQDVQEKLRTEIEDILKKNGGQITYEGVKEMKYLQMVIDETLRISGPIGSLVRVAARNFQVPNSKIVIEKGTLTFIPVYAIHNDPEIYPNPSKFDPERFSDENKATRHPMAFIPFGDGPRNCIGLRFGLMQTKIAIIQLLLKFRIKPTEKTPESLSFDPKVPVLSQKDGMWLEMNRI